MFLYFCNQPKECLIAIWEIGFDYIEFCAREVGLHHDCKGFGMLVQRRDMKTNYTQSRLSLKQILSPYDCLYPSKLLPDIPVIIVALLGVRHLHWRY